MYDIAVIGKGLMGSAALRHLTLSFPELRVCIIGPDEPADRKAHPGVFASHYDQGRITRVLDPSPMWAALARESIGRYPAIEEAGGVRFHHAVGCLRATDLPAHVAALDICARRFRPPHQRLDAAECKAAYPFLAFSDDFVAWDEKGDAGYINPRSLIEAQLSAAARSGAEIIREIVASIDGSGEGVAIRTRAGRAVRARKALLTAGGYSNTVLERKLKLPTRSHTILLAELPRSEAVRLRGMPAIITAFDHPAVSSLYMLPPVVYPDGKTYIKLGPGGRQEELPATEHFLHALDDDRELLRWFQSDGREDIAEAMKVALHSMLPGLSVLSYHSTPCLITSSAHGYPYIDALEAGALYVTIAGNGASAKSSDEIGRMGALLCATDKWHSDLDRQQFRAVYADGGSK